MADYEFPATLRFTTDDGFPLVIGACGPALIQFHMGQTVRREHETNLVDKVHAEGYDPPVIAAGWQTCRMSLDVPMAWIASIKPPPRGQGLR